MASQRPAALEFALTLYRALLGLPATDGGPRPAGARRHARRDAPRADDIAREACGRQTWGAYQHYGNPHFRLFDRLEPQAPATVADAVHTTTADGVADVEPARA